MISASTRTTRKPLLSATGRLLATLLAIAAVAGAATPAHAAGYRNLDRNQFAVMFHAAGKPIKGFDWGAQPQARGMATPAHNGMCGVKIPNAYNLWTAGLAGNSGALSLAVAQVGSVKAKAYITKIRAAKCGKGKVDYKHISVKCAPAGSVAIWAKVRYAPQPYAVMFVQRGNVILSVSEGYDAKYSTSHLAVATRNLIAQYDKAALAPTTKR